VNRAARVAVSELVLDDLIAALLVLQLKGDGLSAELIGGAPFSCQEPVDALGASGQLLVDDDAVLAAEDAGASEGVGA
jgi:hypothetical protein